MAPPRRSDQVSAGRTPGAHFWPADLMVRRQKYFELQPASFPLVLFQPVANRLILHADRCRQEEQSAGAAEESVDVKQGV